MSAAAELPAGTDSESLPAVAERLWQAASVLNPEGERLLLNTSGGGLLVGVAGGELVVMAAGAASELAACNRELTKLQRTSPPSGIGAGE
jgi:hypothetical protein